MKRQGIRTELTEELAMIMLFVDNTFLLTILFADITFCSEEDPENRVAEKLLTGGNFK